MLNNSMPTRWTAVITIDDPNEAKMRAVARLTRGHGAEVLGVGEATLSSDDTGGEAAEDLAAARALRDVAVQLTSARPLPTPTRHRAGSVTASDIVTGIAVPV